MKRTSPSSAAAPAAAAKVMAKTSSPSATAVRAIKMQQWLGLIAIIVAINCLKINSISANTIDDPEDNLKQIRQKCITSHKLSDEHIKQIYSHKLFTPTTTLASMPKPLQCYCLCYLNESGIFVDDKPNETFLRDILPLMINDKKKSTAVLDKCLKLQGADKCEIGFNFELCLIKETGLYL